MINDDSSNTINADKPLYWGLVATLLLSFLVFLAFSIIQGVGVMSYIAATDPEATKLLANPNAATNLETQMNQYLFNGDAIAIGEIPAAIVGVLLIIWFASMKKAVGAEQYLELVAPTLKSLFLFLGLIAVAMVLMESITYLLNRPTPEFMTKVYESTTNKPLLWMAVVIAAPFFEEFLFRGFLFEGILRSPLGSIGAILITSGIWAIIHSQYGWFEIISIFFIGILLAIAKIKSKSLYVPIAMHMLMNLVASISMEFVQ